ncbi:MAG: glycosyltransferase [Aggregatilineales bacterium]
MKKILFVGMAQSVHLQRWISQLEGQDWEIHLFPSIDDGLIHTGFRHITVYHSIFTPQPDIDSSVKERGLRIGIPGQRTPKGSPFWFLSRLLNVIRSRLNPNYRQDDLRRIIKRIQPDIVHSVEFQQAGYITLKIKKQLGDQFPTWIATNYGSDIYLFGRLAEHRERIREILELCDYYDCECERDVTIAQEMGLRGEVIRPVFPNSGGFNMEEFDESSRQEPVSSRKQIILKGYQHFAGRALVALQAFARCVDILQDYTIVIYSAHPDVQIAAELLEQDTGLKIKLLPPASHEDILREFGKSRIYIGLSISDAISTSMLEAMTMGAFPIQSNTACADEWVTDGETALIIPPEDVDVLVNAIRTALDDDALVDNAAKINLQTARDRLDNVNIRPQIVDIYRKILG